MHGIKQPLGAKKRFGQHFLRDASVIQKILDAIPYKEGKKIVEIGPGRGALTEPLYERLEKEGRAEDLTLVELDRDLLEDLKGRFPKTTLINADATGVDWSKITGGKSWLLVGNLPYNAGTAMVNDAFWGTHPPEYAVVMLQKEVGERMLGTPPDMSVLSVAMQLKTTGKRICTVKPGAFVPPPKVDSIVIALAAKKGTNVKEDETIIAVAKRGFAHARKQLRQTLGGKDEKKREEVGELLKKEGLSSLARPQELSLKAWAALAEHEI
jgi:16S rRNA (adenine1518-N6/adenine1519-N6)-dimethyltransferase